MKYLAIAIAWGFVAVACLSVTQGTYEDHQQMAEYGSLTRTPPALWQARGLLNLSVWAQARTHASPAAMRLGSLALAAIASALTGVLAWQLGLCAWFALGIMALHPLGVEAVATISGRGELLATIGVLAACCLATRRWTISTMCGMIGCMAFAYLGKETAVIGLVLVPLTALTMRRRTGPLVWVGLALIVALAWWYRDLGLVDTSRSLTWGAWALHQSAAAFRLVLLSIIPIGQTVDPDIDALAFAWMVGAVAGLAVFVMLTIGLWRTQRIAAFGLAWIAVVILPRVIVMTPRSYFNEHQWYPALVGVAIVGAALAGSVEAAWAGKI